MSGHFEVAGLTLPREEKVAGGGTTSARIRRASQRFKAKPGSIVSYVEGAGAICDLSMDGMFLVDSEPLPVDTKITFSLMLGSETVSLQGIVRRTVAREGMGIQFTEVSRELRRRLVVNLACLA